MATTTYYFVVQIILSELTEAQLAATIPRFVAYPPRIILNPISWLIKKKTQRGGLFLQTEL